MKPTARYCPCCAGYLRTQTKIIKVMGRWYIPATGRYKGQRRRKQNRISRREQVCDLCQIKVIIVDRKGA